MSGICVNLSIDGIGKIPFSKAGLVALGLQDVNPSFIDASTMRWTSVQGLMEISLFKGASGSEYAYIKVKTE